MNRVWRSPGAEAWNLPAHRALLPALVLLATGCTAANQGAFEKVFSGESRVVDLSHPIADGLVSGQEAGPCTVRPLQTLDVDGRNVNLLSMPETAGTNIEAPARVLSSGATVDRLPLMQFMGYGVVLDIRDKVSDRPDYALTQHDIELWEADHGAIPPEAIVLIRTGWDSRWGDPERYWNAGPDGKPHFPGVSAEAADFLIRERRVHAIGVDTASPYLGSGDTSGQRAFLVTGKFHINNLTHLEELPVRGAVVLAFPIPVAGGSGAPARVLAIIPQEKTAVEPGKKKVQQGNEAGFEQNRPGAMGY